MAEALKNYQKIIKEESAKLKKLVSEIKYYQLTIRNFEMEIQKIDKELAKQTKEWFDRERRGKNVLLRNTKMNENMDEEDGGGEMANIEEYEEDVDNVVATPDLPHQLHSA